MEHELVKHCQDMDAKFYGLTKKDFVLLSFKISDLKIVSAKKKTWASCSHSKYCSMGRIIGFNP